MYDIYTLGVRANSSPHRFPSYTVRATDKDITEFFGNVRRESNEGKYQILTRKWYHERGLGIPYVQKTNDSNEVCAILWLVMVKDLEKSGLGDRFERLQEDECMIENTYTLERFRGKGVMTSWEWGEILSNKGLKYSKGYIDENNISMFRYEKRNPGDKIFERVLERHLFFRVTRKILERFDPPIPFADLPDIK